MGVSAVISQARQSESFESDARGLRLQVLATAGLARRAFEDAVLMLSDHRASEMDEEWPEVASRLEHGCQRAWQESQALLRQWGARDSRAASVVQASLALAEVQMVLLTSVESLRRIALSLLEKTPSPTVQYVEPLSDRCYDNLRELCSVYADGDFEAVCRMLAGEEEDQRLLENVRQVLVEGAAEDAERRDYLLATVAIFAAVGQASYEAGRAFLAAARN